MGVPTTAISDDDPGFAYAFQIATDVVPACFLFPDIYTITVYNWAGSNLIQFQQDYPGQNYFTVARAAYGINNFVAGVVSEANDVSTGERLAIGEGLRNLDLLSLQKVKDPYGRQAVAYMQQIGTLWGLT
jgi:hypothetical protein